MLLNNGELDGVRVLSKAAVQAMRTDCLGDLPHSGPLLPKDTGFGLTFAISKTTSDQGTKESTPKAPPTRFLIDPEKTPSGSI